MTRSNFFTKASRNPTVFVFIGLWCIGTVLAFAQPPYGVSDEPAHAVKALATARLNFSGPETIGQFDYPAQVFEVPAAYTSIWHFVCYSSNTDATPICAEPFPSDENLLLTSSTAGAYPPLYYVAVGSPGWLWPGEGGLAGMRLMSVLLWSSTLALAFSVLSLVCSSRLALATVFIAFTPTALALGSTVNPFGWEISLFVLLWATTLVSIFGDSQNLPSGRLHYLSWLSAIAISLIRPASFIWTFGMMAAVACLLLFRSLRPLNTDLRRMTISSVSPLMASTMLSLGWWAVMADKASFGGGGGSLGTTAANVRYSFDRLDDYLLQLHGFFGWTEFYAPTASLLCWIFALVLVAIRSSFSTSQRNIVLVGVTGVIAAPLVLEGLRATSSGLGYQGRYILPLAVGLPILMSIFPSSDTPGRNRLGPPLLALGGTAIAVVQVVRRYEVGLSGPLIWFREPTWEPFGGSALQLALLAIATLSLSIVLMRPRS